MFFPTKNKNTWLDRKEKDKERKLEAVEEPNLVSYYFTLSSSVTAADFTVVETAADKGTWGIIRILGAIFRKVIKTYNKLKNPDEHYVPMN